MKNYDRLARSHKVKMLIILNDLMRHFAWNEERLMEHRRDSLRATLKFAIRNSPWHRRRLRGLDVENFDPADIDQLPAMTKKDVMANWDDIVTDRRLTLDVALAHMETLHGQPRYLFDEYHVMTTGGTTGEAGIFCWSSDELSTSAAASLRAAAYGNVSPKKVAICGARHPTHFSLVIPRWLGGQDFADAIIPVDQPLKNIIEQLNAYQPDSLHTLGSMVRPLAEAALSGSLRVHLVKLMTGGDVLTEESSLLAEKAFGIKPVQRYGTVEVGHVASHAAGEDDLVVNDDLLLLEAVDQNGRSVNSGCLSDHALITSFYHRTLPLVRYRIEDRIALSGKVIENDQPIETSINTAYSRLHRIEGRTCEILQYPEATIHAYVFYSLFDRYPDISAYQVRQTRDGVDVLLVCHEGVALDGLHDELQVRMLRSGLQNSTVTLIRQDAIPRTASGKHRPVVPLPDTV